ncbi:hypothetical protein EUBSIR_02216 [[Eubacterium] siraeum DSM 15702]|uniref:Uncharacterized protein n=1 Tax=[Eubacterium] siraeum DSM 15702 TaxID=428128 RepID=B0MQU9_9FIRM|nr:hypothetical protein EUBSIR_02216 [[Eubacterium] siraeum DSM 15702]
MLHCCNFKYRIWILLSDSQYEKCNNMYVLDENSCRVPKKEVKSA